MRLPKWLVLGVIGVSMTPSPLHALGMNFSSIQPIPDFANSGTDGAIRSLSGTYAHNFPEWSATVTALFTAWLAFTHFRIKRDVVTPIIGLALLSAGTVDAFHTLAADRLIDATADNRMFIPFTWAISRSFNAVVPLAALALLFLTRKHREGTQARQSMWLIQGSGLLWGAIAYGPIDFCASSKNLPNSLGRIDDRSGRRLPLHLNF